MPDRTTREEGHFRRGSESGRKFFSLFGIRSARDERQRSDDAADEATSDAE